MSIEEFEELKNVINDFEFVGDMGELILDLSSAFKISAANSDPDQWSMDNLANQTFYEKLVLKLLMVIGNIMDKHKGCIHFPEFSIGTESLTSRGKLEIESHRARERAMNHEGGKVDLKLTPRERGDVERWRLIERSVEARGDKNDLKQHRKNLKAVFESAGSTDDPPLQRTFDALDAGLEADICYMESLSNPKES